MYVVESTPDLMNAPDPVIPAINDYGTFDLDPNFLSSHHASSSRHRSKRRSSDSSTQSSESSQSHTRPLWPSAQPRGAGTKVSRDLIPFAGLFVSIARKIKSRKMAENGHQHQHSVDPFEALWEGSAVDMLSIKHRPKIAGNGHNLPLEILRCVSEWFSVLEDRATVPGAYCSLYGH